MILDYETKMFWKEGAVENAHILFALPHFEPNKSQYNRLLNELESNIEKRFENTDHEVLKVQEGVGHFQSDMK
jgi:hypothetical protein